MNRFVKVLAMLMALMLCVGLTALQSIAAALPLGAVSAAANALPLGSMGFGWVLPAAVGLLAGMLLRSTTPHEP